MTGKNAARKVARQKAERRKTLRKQQRETARSTARVTQAAVSTQLAKHNGVKKASWSALIDALVENPGALELPAEHPLATAQALCAAAADRDVVAFGELLRWANRACRRLLSETWSLTSLFHIARNHKRFVRTLNTLDVKAHQPRQVVAQLAEHLLARYPVPRFAASVFCEPDGALPLQAWFMALGDGKNIRAIAPHVQLTKRAAHLFGAAPCDLNMIQALRYGQVRAAGGGKMLARQVAQSLLGRATFASQEGFWARFCVWLAGAERAGDRLPNSQLSDVIEYLLATLREDASFSMKGRSMRALLERVQPWAQLRDHAATRGEVKYAPCGVAPSVFRTASAHRGFGVSWQFEEVLDSARLHEEGRRMRHCVFTYQPQVEGGHVAIFTLWRSHLGERKRALTIEVIRKQIAIGQVRGRSNRAPTEEELAIVRRWSKAEGLRLRL